MMRRPYLVPSVLAPSWWWTVRRRVRGIAAGAAQTGAGVGIFFWLTAGAPPPTVPARALAPSASLSTLSIAPPFAPARVAAPARTGAEALTVDMAPVFSGGGLRVLLRGDVDERWVSGPPVVSVDEGMTIATRRLSKAGRAEVGDLIGTELRLYRADGRSCRARVTGAAALGRFDAGGTLDGTADPEAAWDAAADWLVIAGDLEPLDGNCDQAVWARSESLPAPAMATPGKPTVAVRQTALAALKARPEYRDLADESGIESEEIEVSTLATGDETVVVATLSGESCAGPWPIMTALWRLEPGGELRFLGAEETITGILAGADTDGDGRIDLVGQHDVDGLAILRRAGSRFQIDERAPVGSLGCRC